MQSKTYGYNFVIICKHYKVFIPHQAKTIDSYIHYLLCMYNVHRYNFLQNNALIEISNIQDYTYIILQLIVQRLQFQWWKI